MVKVEGRKWKGGEWKGGGRSGRVWSGMVGELKVGSGRVGSGRVGSRGRVSDMKESPKGLENDVIMSSLCTSPDRLCDVHLVPLLTDRLKEYGKQVGQIAGGFLKPRSSNICIFRVTGFRNNTDMKNAFVTGFSSRSSIH